MYCIGLTCTKVIFELTLENGTEKDRTNEAQHERHILVDLGTFFTKFLSVF